MMQLSANRWIIDVRFYVMSFIHSKNNSGVI